MFGDAGLRELTIRLVGHRRPTDTDNRRAGWHQTVEMQVIEAQAAASGARGRSPPPPKITSVTGSAATGLEAPTASRSNSASFVLDAVFLPNRLSRASATRSISRASRPAGARASPGAPCCRAKQSRRAPAPARACRRKTAAPESEDPRSASPKRRGTRRIRTTLVAPVKCRYRGPYPNMVRHACDRAPRREALAAAQPAPDPVQGTRAG